jgi:hypothetical protein
VLVPLPVDGVYSVTRDATGANRVRGIEGTTGWVALRLAYRDKTLPPALRDTNLAEITDTVDRSIHPASLPIGLGASVVSEKPVVELVCGDGAGGAHRIAPAVPTNVPFKARETCRIILHRELLKPEDGDQAMRIAVTISDVGGVTRNEASFDQRIILRPGTEPRYVYLSGITAPFDKILVRASLMADSAHYAVGADDKISAPQAQWQVIVGTDDYRLFATVALPTGLFRVADKVSSGLLGLSAGVLGRAVALTPQGEQWPVGLEGGLIVMDIAGDITKTRQVAVVGGVSVSVPIANVSRTTQVAISLHAWLEYEISRVVLGQPGSPVGFVFGPSFSVGDIGLNF